MAKHNLVIVESPAKAKTIGKYLGKDYEVKACMGHLRDLPKSKLGVDIEKDFEPEYKPIKGKEDIISDLKQSAADSDTVYLATDPDREGETISWHLKELLNPPGHLQRDHQEGGPGEHPGAPAHRPGPGGCPAGPPDSGPDRGLSALTSAVEEDSPGSERRPCPVRSHPYGG